MKCNKCGKELILVGEVDINIFRAVNEYNTKITDTMTCLSNIPAKFMKKGDLYNYVTNELKDLAESDFLLNNLMLKLKKKYDIDINKDIHIIDKHLYIHS